MSIHHPHLLQIELVQLIPEFCDFIALGRKMPQQLLSVGLILQQAAQLSLMLCPFIQAIAV